MYSWKKYNLKNERLVKKFRKYNTRYKLNMSENSYYNHTRDFFALNLISKKKINILDYGSNFLACSNLDNKIECKNINYILYNPFEKREILKKNFGKLKIKCINQIDSIKRIKFDIINFGSSLQYLENFENLIKSINFKLKSKILFSATPITFGRTYYTKQLNAKNLNQKIYSIKQIEKVLKKKKFTLTFKSCLNFKFSSIKKKKNTFFMNLIFLKS